MLFWECLVNFYCKVRWKILFAVWPTIFLGPLSIAADTRALLCVQPWKFVVRVLPEAVQQEWVERLTSHTNQNARALQQTLHTVNLKKHANHSLHYIDCAVGWSDYDRIELIEISNIWLKLNQQGLLQLPISDEEMCYDGLKPYQLKVNGHGKSTHLVYTFSHTNF